MHIHLIAICGAGMGALAGLLKKAGHHVTGSDQNVYPPMSTYLSKLGIQVYDGYSPENISETPDLVVIGNAIRKENPESQAVISAGIDFLSFPGALRRFFLCDRTTIAVTGTHGKTTTTALLAWILTSAGYDPSFLVGGICLNFDGPVRLGRGDYFVIEGDEYDTAFFDKVPKFLRYQPDVAVLANVEFDHADIYPNFDAVFDAFAALVANMPPNGFLAAGVDCPSVRRLVENAQCIVTTYATDHPADISARDISFRDAAMRFCLTCENRNTAELKSPLVGMHNLKNILAAYAICKNIGVAHDEFAKGLASFKGIKRRQEVRGVVNDIVVIDDFAHHPTAVRETLNALKMQWGRRRIVAIFEPRTNTSRRKYFQDKYAKSFHSADIVIVAPVYNQSMISSEERFDSEKLALDLRDIGKDAASAADLDETLKLSMEKLRPGDVAVLFSNGGFGGLHEKLLEKLTITNRN